MKDISREDLLMLLSSMGVVFEKDTKMPLEMLDKRLEAVLDTSQQFERLFTTTPLDPDTLPKWCSSESLFKSTRRNNISEVIEGTLFQPKQADLARKEDTFKEMRQTMNCIAHACDMNTKDILLLDVKEGRGIFIKILEVYKVNDNVPLFLFVYKEIAPTPNASLQDTLDLLQSNEASRITVPISHLEARTLLRLLRKNSKRLHAKHQALIDAKGGNKLKIYASFLLPLNPISQRDIGSLSVGGCYVCGKKISSKCMGCLSVSYCGKACQVSDWKFHKSACRSLSGGTWKTITLSATLEHLGIPGLSTMFTSLLNRNDSLQQMPPTTEGALPADTHKGKIFLAKFQVGITGNGSRPGHMLIYDRQRSLQIFWLRMNQTKLFDQATDIIGPRLKFYRWLRCVEGDQYEICLDRAPKEIPNW